MTPEQISQAKTTELLAILAAGSLTIREIQDIRRELKARTI